MFTKILLDHAPEELNEIELAVVLWQKDAQMTRFLDDLLNQGRLRFEVWLPFENALATTVGGTVWTFFASSTQVRGPEVSLLKNGLDALGLARVCLVVRGKRHCLRLPDAVRIDEPAVTKLCLLSTRIDVHSGNKQRVLGIRRVTLRVVNHNEGLISGAMHIFNCGDDLFPQLRM